MQLYQREEWCVVIVSSHISQGAGVLYHIGQINANPAMKQKHTDRWLSETERVLTDMQQVFGAPQPQLLRASYNWHVRHAYASMLSKQTREDGEEDEDDVYRSITQFIDPEMLEAGARRECWFVPLIYWRS